MEQRILSIVSVIYALMSTQAMAASSDVPLPALFQYSPTQLGRTVMSTRATLPFAPRLIFKNEIALNESGEAPLGESCRIATQSPSLAPARGFFNTHLNTTPGGKILPRSSYEMRLISYQQEVLKIELVASKETLHTLTLTCTHSNIQSWTVSEFESGLGQSARVYASEKLKSFKFLETRSVASVPATSLNSLKGSVYNGIFGSGLPGTMGIQLLLGANLKAYAEETNAPLMVGKRCKLMSQNEAAFNDHYLKGSKFAFREYRVSKTGKVELVFDNWNHSPHQVRVECRGDLAQVKQMTVAEVEHDLNGTIQFYRK